MAPATPPRSCPYAEITNRIVQALEAGTVPWVRPWTSTAGSSGAPRNGASGHRYKGTNVLLTGMSGFGDSRWYSYQQAQGLGGQVRRGEKGTKIIFWQFIDKVDEDGQETNLVHKRVPILKTYSVFNYEQIDWANGSETNDEVIEPAVGFEAAAELLASSGATVRHGGSMAAYSPTLDTIRLPTPEAFTDISNYWATGLHELVHWTGHQSRLDRRVMNRFGSEAYAFEELVAELGAAFLCSNLGIGGHLQHAEYITNWLTILKGDKHAIFTASRLATQAADFLVGTGDAAHREAA